VAEPARLTIVLMAGGLATRLPGKLALPIGGMPMLERVYRQLTKGGLPCIVSARKPLDATLASAIPAPVVLDAYPDAGPLGGLVSAAHRVTTPLLFAAAGDLPNLDASFVDAIVREYDRLDGSGAAPDAVVPVWPDGKLEPLAALYNARAIARSGKAALDAGRRKVTAALEGLHVATFAVGPEDEARLANVNTPGDYNACTSS
jgi:molybdopterin-guanine dinucleotide biosynthesis protein A